MKILGLDPGGETGWCCYNTRTHELESGQLGPKEHHRELWRLMADLAPRAIACERFDYRRNLGNVDLIPREYIGVVKLYSNLTNTKMVLQTQLKGHKGLWTDDKFKALGIYEKGKPHAMDAQRQALMYAVNEASDSYWIERYGEAK